MGKIKDFDYYSNHGIDMLRLNLMTGALAAVCTKNIVGFCCNEEHKGFLTNKLIKKHECDKKGCPYFKKYEDYPYWKRQQPKKKPNPIFEQKKNPKRDYEKQKRESLANRKSEKQKNALMLSYLRERLDREGLPIFVTSISKEASLYSINYVSFERRNDWMDYFHLAVEMSKLFNGRFKVKHIKNFDGAYATIDDYFSSQGYHSW